MTRNNRIIAIAGLSLFAALPLFVHADVTGADPRLTNAPGESNCTACHSGTSVNGGSGWVKILLPGDATYTPGVKQRIQVQVADPAQRRWGFELSARTSAGGQAGDLAAVDSNTQVECANGRSKPCSASAPVQYITHTLSGTRPGTSGLVTFDFDWTPPSTDSGTVTMYASGNAANGNNSDTGDHIYTTSISLGVAQQTSNKPSINADGGVTNGASYLPAIMQGTWVTIKGTNLSSTTRSWAGADIVYGDLPTSLDGVSVTINGKAAYVEYISPTQVNVLSPADASTGQVEVKVTSNGQTSDPYTATLQAFSPAFFTFDGKYLAATHSDNSLLGKAGLFASAPNATTPAKPGETIILYATGLGPTNPSIAAGTLTAQLASLTTAYTVTIGGQQANVSFAGLIPSFAGLYQLNVVVPDVPDGDQPVVIQIGGATSQSAASITVQR